VILLKGTVNRAPLHLPGWPFGPPTIADLEESPMKRNALVHSPPLFATNLRTAGQHTPKKAGMAKNTPNGDGMTKVDPSWTNLLGAEGS